MKIFKSNIPWLLVLVVLITSCEKTEINYEPDRKTIVKIKDAENEVTQKARDVLPTIDEFILIDVRRDPTRESDLNQPLTVTLQKDASLISAYNSAHGSSYIELPASSYTLSADIANIQFAAGEDIKTIKIRLDKSGLSLSNQYALAFKIANAGSGAVISNSYKEAIYAIGIKNQYHGLYHSTGIFHHPTAGDRAIDEDKELFTAGPNSVKANLGDLGSSGYQMILTVDPTSNLVTITPAGVTPNIDQSWGPNYYNPATKSFHLYYSYNVAAPRKVEETITLK